MPQLTGASISFRTNDENKDHDTNVTVEVRDSAGARRRQAAHGTLARARAGVGARARSARDRFRLASRGSWWLHGQCGGPAARPIAGGHLSVADCSTIRVHLHHPPHLIAV